MPTHHLARTLVQLMTTMTGQQNQQNFLTFHNNKVQESRRTWNWEQHTESSGHNQGHLQWDKMQTYLVNFLWIFIFESKELNFTWFGQGSVHIPDFTIHKS